LDNRKIIIASYFVTGVVVWHLTREAMAFAMTSYAIRKLTWINPVKEALPIVVGVLTFGILMVNRTVGNFLDEVVMELRKVTWPSREDVVKSTIVVLGCVLFASGVLAIFDIAFGKVISYLLHS